MSALQSLLATFRSAAVTEREKGTYFEELCVQYLRNEATYRDLYSDVWTYGEWAKLQGLEKKDAGIDLVAKTQGTYEYHAIQCKFYAEDYKVQKADIDSFFTASGKKTFSHHVIIVTTNNWSDNAEAALFNQHPPVTKIDLNDLENSQIDWSKYKPKKVPVLKDKKKLREHQTTALGKVQTGLQTADRGKLIMAWHRQRRQRLGHRNHGQCQIPAGAVSAGYYGKSRNDENCECIATTGYQLKYANPK